MKVNCLITGLYALAGLASAYPTHWDSNSGPKFTISGPKDPGTFESFQAAGSLRALLLLKNRLGRDGVFQLLRPDIDASNAFWHSVQANSTPGVWVPATAHVVVRGPGLTAASFAAWFGADTGDADKLLRANPEHYFESVTADPVTGVLVADILEAWDGKVTHFKIPEYGAPDRAAHPFLPKLPSFPQQFSGEGVLQDGTGVTFAVVHNSWRDTDDGKGVEAILTVWVHDGTPESLLEGLRQHQAVEFTNWLSNAQKDLASGKFKPS